MLIALDSISQTSADTVCLPLNQLKIAINKIEEGKVMAKEIVLLKDKLQSVERRVVVKDSLILVYIKNESNYRRLINNYESNISNNATIVANLEKSLKYQKKVANRQKLQKWMVAVLGVGLGYLIGII
jgi:hypothetical protein